MQIVFFNPGNNAGSISFSDIFSCKNVYDQIIKAFDAFACDGSVYMAMPENFKSVNTLGLRHLLVSDGKIVMDNRDLSREKSPWIVLTDGRYVTSINWSRLFKMAELNSPDIVSVKVSSDLLGYHEKIITHDELHAVGFRRFYNESMQFSSKHSQWPHHLLIRTSLLQKIIQDNRITLDFNTLMQISRDKSLIVNSFEVGGKVADILNESDLLDLNAYLMKQQPVHHGIPVNAHTSSRIIGQVAFGKNCQVSENTVISGPSVISDNVQIGKNAVIAGSVIGTGIIIPDNADVRNRVIFVSEKVDISPGKTAESSSEVISRNCFSVNDSYVFKRWPWYSYPNFGKRIIDIIFSSLILALFLPFFLVIGLVIKLTSKGPVFYVARRQGRYGKEFGCIKFRSMMVEAEDLQEKLRIVNEVDGPQFKMKHDPRVNGVGKFLRDTCIDEIPQFINVLKGDMSIVGPRPSPEQENTTCPWWRYARLSVRPGITGLWQIARTRDESKDFQEWLIYDTRYVKKLSFSQDFYIALKTAQKLINDFIEQF